MFIEFGYRSTYLQVVACESQGSGPSGFLATLLRYRDPAQKVPQENEDNVTSRATSRSNSAALEVGHSGAMESGTTTSGRQDNVGRTSWLNRLSGVYSAAGVAPFPPCVMPDIGGFSMPGQVTCIRASQRLAIPAMSRRDCAPPILEKKPRWLRAERQFARGAKALQKLAVPSSGLHDYEEAKTRLEQATAKLKGQDRLTALRRYVAVLEEPEKPRPGTTQPVIVAQPASPALVRSGEEEDWQQLSAVSLQPGSATSDRSADTKPGVAMFINRSGGDEPSEPMTFRELFLRSNALEHIVAGEPLHVPVS